MGVSSRYKLRHRTKENRGNKNEHPQKTSQKQSDKKCTCEKDCHFGLFTRFPAFFWVQKQRCIKVTEKEKQVYQKTAKN